MVLELTFLAIASRAPSPMTLPDDVRAFSIALQQLYLASIPDRNLKLINIRKLNK